VGLTDDRCIIILIILFLALQSYQQKETIFNPLIDFTNKNPVKFDLNPIIELHNKTASFFEPPNPERKNQSKEALEYLNQIRKKYGREELVWDDRIYRLAVFRSKDMLQKKYFDHVTPEGKCAEDFKKDFSITEYGSFAENLGGMTSYEDGETFKVNVEGITYYIGGEPAPDTNVKEAIDGWMESRGHRYALLYPYKDYKKSAIGCYKSICTFLVLTTEPFQCVRGDEGIAYWKSVGKQAGEI